MSKSKFDVRSAKERRIAMIPVDAIVVVNPRNRDEKLFEKTVRSIDKVGLQKPICVNKRNYEKTGKYELVCGEGRLEAHRRLGKTHIDAEIINVDEGKALLMGLAENLTRTKKDIMEFAKRIVKMHDQGKGISYDDLAKITGKSAMTMRNYIELMQKGEERLIRGVENDIFPMDFAIKIIQFPAVEVRRFLMNEFQDGKIATSELKYIKRILDIREAKGQSNTELTHKKLSASIREETKRQKQFLRQQKVKRNDACYLVGYLKKLWADEKFNQMVGELTDLTRPEVKGLYVD